MNFLICVITALLLSGLCGCEGMKMSNPYLTEVDRTDQKVNGNRGYLKGTPPPAEDRTGLKRTLITVDVDLPPTTKEREEMAREDRGSNVAREASANKNTPKLNLAKPKEDKEEIK